MTRIILLAAGASRRFGSQKLLADFQGKPLYTWAFAAAAEAGSPVTVVTRRGLLDGPAGQWGFCCVLAPEGESQAVSVRLGTASACKGENLCFFVCDQPHFPGYGLKNFVERFEKSGLTLGRVQGEGKMGSPTIFAPSLAGELMALSGDEGGRSVFKGREGETYYHQVPPLWLRDYDRPW